MPGAWHKPYARPCACLQH